MLFNLTCERALHPALLGADIASTLLELLCPSQRGLSRESAGSRNSDAANTTTTAAAGGGEGGGGGEGDEGSAATTADTHGALVTGPPESGGGLEESSGGGDGDRNDANDGDQQKPTSFENPQESGVLSGVKEVSGRGEGLEGTTHPPPAIPTGAAAAAAVDGHVTAGAAKGARALDSDTISGPFTKHRPGNDSIRGISGAKGLPPGGGGSPDSIAGGGVMAQRPSLQVRRNVLGAVMNLTTSSLEHQRLDPSAVMCLLTLIIHEDPNERCGRKRVQVYQVYQKCATSVYERAIVGGTCSIRHFIILTLTCFLSSPPRSNPELHSLLLTTKATPCTSQIHRTILIRGRGCGG